VYSWSHDAEYWGLRT